MLSLHPPRKSSANDGGESLWHGRVLPFLLMFKKSLPTHGRTHRGKSQYSHCFTLHVLSLLTLLEFIAILFINIQQKQSSRLKRSFCWRKFSYFLFLILPRWYMKHETGTEVCKTYLRFWIILCRHLEYVYLYQSAKPGWHTVVFVAIVLERGFHLSQADLELSK